MIDHGTTLPKERLSLVTWSLGSRMSREAAARAWVDAAKQAGLNPRVAQQSLSSDDAGEWHIMTSNADQRLPGHPGQLPNELWDEAFLILEAEWRYRPRRQTQMLARSRVARRYRSTRHRPQVKTCPGQSELKRGKLLRADPARKPSNALRARFFGGRSEKALRVPRHSRGVADVGRAR